MGNRKVRRWDLGKWIGSFCYDWDFYAATVSGGDVQRFVFPENKGLEGACEIFHK
jgi:hypothetical protein